MLVHWNCVHYSSVYLYEKYATKNITLSADEHLIETARERAKERARAELTTPNEQFRPWLEDYVQRKQQADAAMETIKALRGSLFTGRLKYTRDEMNER